MKLILFSLLALGISVSANYPAALPASTYGVPAIPEKLFPYPPAVEELPTPAIYSPPAVVLKEDVPTSTEASPSVVEIKEKPIVEDFPYPAAVITEIATPSFPYPPAIIEHHEKPIVHDLPTIIVTETPTSSNPPTTEEHHEKPIDHDFPYPPAIITETPKPVTISYNYSVPSYPYPPAVLVHHKEPTQDLPYSPAQPAVVHGPPLIAKEPQVPAAIYGPPETITHKPVEFSYSYTIPVEAPKPVFPYPPAVVEHHTEPAQDFPYPPAKPVLVYGPPSIAKEPQIPAAIYGPPEIITHKPVEFSYNYTIPAEIQKFFFPYPPSVVKHHKEPAQDFPYPPAKPALVYGPPPITKEPQVPAAIYGPPEIVTHEPVEFSYSYTIPVEAQKFFFPYPPSVVKHHKEPAQDFPYPPAKPALVYGPPPITKEPQVPAAIYGPPEIVTHKPVEFSYSYTIPVEAQKFFFPYPPSVVKHHKEPAQDFPYPPAKPALVYGPPPITKEPQVPAAIYGPPEIVTHKPVEFSYSYTIPAEIPKPIYSYPPAVPAQVYGPPATIKVEEPHPTYDVSVAVPLTPSKPALIYGPPPIVEVPHIPEIPEVITHKPIKPIEFSYEYEVPAKFPEIAEPAIEIPKPIAPHTTYGAPYQ